MIAFLLTSMTDISWDAYFLFHLESIISSGKSLRPTPHGAFLYHPLRRMFFASKLSTWTKRNHLLLSNALSPITVLSDKTCRHAMILALEAWILLLILRKITYLLVLITTISRFPNLLLLVSGCTPKPQSQSNQLWWLPMIWTTKFLARRGQRVLRVQGLLRQLVILLLTTLRWRSPISLAKVLDFQLRSSVCKISRLRSREAPRPRNFGGPPISSVRLFSVSRSFLKSHEHVAGQRPWIYVYPIHRLLLKELAPTGCVRVSSFWSSLPLPLPGIRWQVEFWSSL